MREGRNNPATIIVKIMKSVLMVLFKVSSLNGGQSKSLKGNSELAINSIIPSLLFVVENECYCVQ